MEFSGDIGESLMERSGRSLVEIMRSSLVERLGKFSGEERLERIWCRDW